MKSSLNVFFQYFITKTSLWFLGAGATEAIIVNPFEVVKVNLQSNRAK